MLQETSPSPEPKEKPFPIGFKEFVAIIAGLMAINALSIDPMLPALPAIGEALKIHDPNDRQWIITAYFIGLGIGSLVFGSLSDRYGRKPVIVVCMVLMLLSTLFCALAQSFEAMLAGRAAAGFFSAGARVLAVSIVRDRFHGDRMARVMSLIFIVFMIVPVLAPAFGQLILLFAPWRWIFGGLLVLGTLLLFWVIIRLPETLNPDHRVEIRVRAMAEALGYVVTHRNSVGYMIASGLVMGGMIGFITSVQQIFFDIFHAEKIFPIAFAFAAGSMAVGSFLNSRLVERIGARRLSQGALIGLIGLNILHSIVASTGIETMPSFLGFQMLTMFCVALTGSNFSAISLEPFSRGAGVASSFQASLTTIMSALLGALTGSLFNGTTVPMALSFLGYGCAALLIVAWAERWTLFTRPHHGPLRPKDEELL